MGALRDGVRDLTMQNWLTRRRPKTIAFNLQDAKNMNLHYRHSGRIPPAGLILVPLVGSLTAVVLGVIYSFAICYIPFIYLNLLFTIGFGMGIGFALAWAARVTQVRSAMFGLLAMVVAVSVGYYAAWGADLLARAGFDEFPSVWMAWHPEALADYIPAFYERGAWTLKGNTTVSGVFLGAVWAIELGAIFYFAWAGVSSFFKENTFCEDCYGWSQRRNGLAVYGTGNALEVSRRLNTGDVNALSGCAPAVAGASDFLGLNAHICPTCDEHCFITLQRVTTTVNAKGESKTETKTMVDRLGVDGASLKTILAAAPAPIAADPQIGPPAAQPSIGPPPAAQTGGQPKVGPPPSPGNSSGSQIGPPPGFR